MSDSESKKTSTRSSQLVSKAPKPITPTRGGTSRSAVREGVHMDRVPNWNTWKHVPIAPLWEAVALSLAIDPRLVSFMSGEWMVGSTKRLFDEGQVFDDRMLVARAAVGRVFPSPSAGLGRTDDLEVQLADFGTWAESIEWTLPDEFPRDRSAGLAKWKHEDLWSERDLCDLCCGLTPNGSRSNVSELNAAGEAIRRAILANALPVASQPIDATAGDRMYAHARFFKPSEATAWAAGKFEKFPFKAADFITQVAPNTRAWPWGTYRTDLLDHLAAAVQQWWVNYTPSDNTTAPTNATVVDWLKTRHVAQGMAEKMASMIRADNLPTGPRK